MICKCFMKEGYIQVSQAQRSWLVKNQPTCSESFRVLEENHLHGSISRSKANAWLQRQGVKSRENQSKWNTEGSPHGCWSLFPVVNGYRVSIVAKEENKIELRLAFSETFNTYITHIKKYVIYVFTDYNVEARTDASAAHVFRLPSRHARSPFVVGISPSSLLVDGRALLFVQIAFAFLLCQTNRSKITK